jgi:recombinational DNA repair protein RecR
MDSYLKQVSCSVRSAENLRKAASACNVFASLTRARLCVNADADNSKKVVFTLYNDLFSVEESDFFFLNAAVSAGATLFLEAADPKTVSIAVTFLLK